ncbi:MAG: hypothetical protein N2053_00725 [Chitinispirillaceae bacterium]|nr:hypothetical protein [Chitinispirillaceae bacterium]
MTTVYITDKKCYFCGTSNKYPMGSIGIGIVGTRDLDGRPTHILRSAVYLWIQRCSACGYCAPEISTGEEEFKEIIESKEYTVQLTNNKFPETANSFLCYSMIMAKKKQFADAGWSSIFAAWICDDNGYKESAVECRRRALQFFFKAKENNQKFAETEEQEKVYLIDTYRRIGDFDTAAALCEEELNKSHSEKILNILYFEKLLIEKKDSSVHYDSEAEDAIR